jgi:hypothetical protein
MSFNFGTGNLFFFEFIDYRSRNTILTELAELYFKSNGETIKLELNEGGFSDGENQKYSEIANNYALFTVFSNSNVMKFLLKSIVENHEIEFRLKSLGKNYDGVFSLQNINVQKMIKFILVVGNNNGEYNELIEKMNIGYNTNGANANPDKSVTTADTNTFKPATYSENWFEGQSTKDILVIVVPIVLIIIYCLNSC